MNVAVRKEVDVVPQEGDTKEFVIGPFIRGAIHDYCRRQRDTNPFHTDPAAAHRLCARIRPVPKGAVVVPGMQVIDEFPRMVIDWLGLGATFSGIRRLSIQAPALSDEPIFASMTVLRRVQARDGAFYVIKAIARVKGLPKPVLTAEFRMFAPTPGTVV